MDSGEKHDELTKIDAEEKGQLEAGACAGDDRES